MKSKEIFTLGLGLVDPWFVKHVEFSDSSLSFGRELHLYLDFTRGHKFSDSSGGTSSAYDTVDHTWEHLNFFQHKCFLHARVPRIKHYRVAFSSTHGGSTLFVGKLFRRFSKERNRKITTRVYPDQSNRKSER